MARIFTFNAMPDEQSFIDEPISFAFFEIDRLGHTGTTLERAGFLSLRDVYFADPEHIQKLRGMGPKSYQALCDFFNEREWPYPPPEALRPKTVSIDEARARKRRGTSHSPI